MNQPNPFPWTYENVEVRDERSAYGVVKDANGRVLFDTINADPSYACEIMREDDEGGVNYYDLQAEANLRLAAKAPAMLQAIKDFLQINAHDGYEFESNAPETYSALVVSIADPK